MSGLALLFHRDRSPLPPDALTGIMARLAHRGPDGQATCLRPAAALGHQHFWVTPEDSGAVQPLSDPQHQIHLIFDGRLDNRDELLAACRLPPAACHLPDATLVLHAYRHWGEACFNHLLGPYAIAIYDATRHSVICARDAIGDRALFYYLDEHRLILASEEHAILAHPAVSDRLDSRTMAYFYAVRTPADGATFFADVRELLPGHAMVVTEQTNRTWRHWQPDPQARLRYRSDAEYADHFRDLLDKSVRCRLRSSTPPAVLMSGGLDSTSVAALAAHAEGGRGQPPPLLPTPYSPFPSPLVTISWLFDELTACDERPWIDALVAASGCRAIQFLGDDAWPLYETDAWPWNPNSPDLNMYRRLNERAYQAAAGVGARTLLTGLFADDLYTRLADWLADLIADGRVREAIAQFASHSRRLGLRTVLRSRTTRRLGCRLLDQLLPTRRLRRSAVRTNPPWLTPEAQAILDEESPLPAAPTPSARERIPGNAGMLGLWLARKVTTESFFANQAGVELLYPYRDRRIIEFMLALPSHQFYNQGQYKFIARNAMEGILPEAIRTRTYQTSLTPLFHRGVSERATSTVWQLLHTSEPAWQPYVRQAWLSNAVPSSEWNRVETMAEIEKVAIWHCLSFALWRQER